MFGGVVAMALAAIAVGAYRARQPVERPPSAVARSTELQRIDGELATWTNAVRMDPYSAMFPAHAAALHLQRGRLTGDYRDAIAAESLSRRSLAHRTQHNAAAFVTLAASLLEQHRFGEANGVARQLVAGQPDVDAYHSLLGETELELGNYALAHRAFSAIRTPSATLSTMAGLARWSEMRGDDRFALSLLRTARRAAERRPGEMREEIGWYYMREADIELRRGRTRAAAEALQAGIALAPTDYRLLAARSRLAAARGEWHDAARYGEASVFNVLDPTTLVVVATAYGELGDTTKAHEAERAADASVRGQAGSLHRAWAMYQLDRGRLVDSITDLARRELLVRRDVQTLDLLAWAELKSGRPQEARRHMLEALRPGFVDPSMMYHAGFVHLASGDTVAGEAMLQRALSTDRRSAPHYARDARAALDRVDAARDGRRTMAARTAARARRAARSLVRQDS